MQEGRSPKKFNDNMHELQSQKKGERDTVTVTENWRHFVSQREFTMSENICVKQKQKKESNTGGALCRHENLALKMIKRASKKIREK